MPSEYLACRMRRGSSEHLFASIQESKNGDKLDWQGRDFSVGVASRIKWSIESIVSLQTLFALPVPHWQWHWRYKRFLLLELMYWLLNIPRLWNLEVEPFLAVPSALPVALGISILRHCIDDLVPIAVSFHPPNQTVSIV